VNWERPEGAVVLLTALNQRAGGLLGWHSGLKGTVNSAQRLSDGARNGQQLICPRPHSDIFGEIFPAHSSRAVNQELSRAGDICSIRTSPWMQQFVTLNHLSLRIREKWECVAPFAPEILRNVWSINANRDRQNSLRFKFR
jgi:hypothetical protein